MKNRQDFYTDCRSKYKTFTYKAYSYNLTEKKLDMRFNFSIDGLEDFEPTWSIDRIHMSELGIDEAKLDKAVFSLGMTELISYWKISCAPTVIVECNSLSDSEISWWKKLYWCGLGEFYYVNGITESQDDFMTIISKGVAPSDIDISIDNISPTDVATGSKPNVMVPVGGGKGSAVSIELLKEKTNLFSFMINPRPAALEMTKTAGLFDTAIIASRTLDQRMLDLNGKDYLNGHTPFSAIVAFSSLITAYINGIPYVAFSNESSSSESTVADSYINHQYSKSFEFEQDFQAYEKAILNTGVYAFSFLRPISELQITRLFSRYKKYLPVFKSCPTGSKENNWCSSCAKCLYMYITLYPFLSDQELNSIFNKNMFEDESLLSDFDKLCGIIPEKPFENVGSRDEVNACLTIAIISIQKDSKSLPALLAHYHNMMDQAGAYRLTTSLALFQELTNSISLSHGLPPYFMSIITEAV